MTPSFSLFYSFLLMIRPPPRSPLFPTRRSSDLFLKAIGAEGATVVTARQMHSTDRCFIQSADQARDFRGQCDALATHWPDRKSTRLNSSHVSISYAVFCLKKKKKRQHKHTHTST